MSYVYLELDVSINPIEPWRPIMIAHMGKLSFESFLNTKKGFKAYIPDSNFSKDEFERLSLFKKKNVSIIWTSKKILPQNWNTSWEKNLNPIRVTDKCVVRADFHPPQKVKYDLIITPEMSFGTGHHQTTQLMMLFILKMNCVGKKFLDMGTGTGILSILAEKKGATLVHAFDKDPWSLKNAAKNIKRNNCKVINAELGDFVPSKGIYDVILANINLNILKDQIPYYSKIMTTGGVLLMSGFYETDLFKLIEFSKGFGFKFIRKFKKDDWLATEFIKK